MWCSLMTQLYVMDLLAYDHADASVHWCVIRIGHMCMANKGMTAS